HPEHGGFVYFTPMRPRHYRVYSQPETCFWCCVGSGMENHGKYGRFIYARSPPRKERDLARLPALPGRATEDALFVNLFMASELDWKEKKLVARQDTRFPDEPRTRLSFIAEAPVDFALMVRHPEWVREGGFSSASVKPAAGSQCRGMAMVVKTIVFPRRRTALVTSVAFVPTRLDVRRGGFGNPHVGSKRLQQ
ncbi:MAG: beta-L-arabinofuranosidase domain-containing protein, partial [Opitutaceae bacterium]